MRLVVASFPHRCKAVARWRATAGEHLWLSRRTVHSATNGIRKCERRIDRVRFAAEALDRDSFG
jgi:hypothetical protein